MSTDEMQLRRAIEAAEHEANHAILDAKRGNVSDLVDLRAKLTEVATLTRKLWGERAQKWGGA